MNFVFVKKLMTVLAIAALGLLAACSKDPAPAPVVQKVSVPTPTYEQVAMRAKADISSIAKMTVEKYGMRNPDACDPATSAPPELLGSKSYQDFPITGPSIYKAACKAAISEAKAGDKLKDAKAVAKAKAKELKLAAKRAKAEEIAAKTAKRYHPSVAQPVRPAAKPASKVAGNR